LWPRTLISSAIVELACPSWRETKTSARHFFG